MGAGVARETHAVGPAVVSFVACCMMWYSDSPSGVVAVEAVLALVIGMDRVAHSTSWRHLDLILRVQDRGGEIMPRSFASTYADRGEGACGLVASQVWYGAAHCLTGGRE